jgi:type II restriction enzyme
VTICSESVAALKSAFEEFSFTYSSGSQSARVKTERWVADWMYCISCGAPRLSQFPNNSPVADFFCPNCQDQFEVKSTKKTIGTRVATRA